MIEKFVSKPLNFLVYAWVTFTSMLTSIVPVQMFIEIVRDHFVGILVLIIAFTIEVFFLSMMPIGIFQILFTLAAMVINGIIIHYA